MNRRHLLGNFVDNPEALFRKNQSQAHIINTSAQSFVQTRRPLKFHPDMLTEFEAMVNKSIREYSAPTTDNICTRLAVEIDCNFELKPRLINMVQAN